MAQRRRKIAEPAEKPSVPQLLEELNAELAEDASIPEPVAIMGVWYPVTVRLPGGFMERQRTKMYITPEGVYLYWAVPNDPTDWTPDWYSPMLPDQPKPPQGWKARNGFQVETEAGPLSVTPMGGCGCGWPMKKWSPDFARRVVAW